MTPICRRHAYDAIIVGARAAGAATALQLARAGLRVLVIDKGREGSDALSTHALMRGGVMRLAQWGVLGPIQLAGAPPIRTTTFHYGDDTLAIPIKPRDGVDALYAPRRTLLDPTLVAAARAAGAEVVWGVRVADLVVDGAGRVRGVAIAEPDGMIAKTTARIVIGADGLHSSVARMVHAPVEHAGHHATATIYRYVPDLGLDGYHWHYRLGVSAGTIPTDGGLTVVFVALPHDRYERERPDGLEPMFRRALTEAAPELAALMAPALHSSPLRAFPGERGFLRRPFGPGWALVGDAGAFRDPLTSHGITEALRDAGWLARAVIRGTESALAEFQTARDDLAMEFMQLSDEVAGFGWTLEEVQQLHVKLARVMAREVAAMASEPAPARSSYAGGGSAVTWGGVSSGVLTSASGRFASTPHTR